MGTTLIDPLPDVLEDLGDRDRGGEWDLDDEECGGGGGEDVLIPSLLLVGGGGVGGASGTGTGTGTGSGTGSGGDFFLGEEGGGGEGFERVGPNKKSLANMTELEG